MFAPRANEIVGKLFPFIHVSADLAHPFSAALFRLLLRFRQNRLGFDVALIIFVRTLVAIKDVTEKNDLMIITKSGLTIRMAVSEIRIAGRATQGVKLINIREGDSIAAVCPVAKSEDEEVAEETTQNED